MNDTTNTTREHTDRNVDDRVVVVQRSNEPVVKNPTRPPLEPLNRRGRRHLAATVRRGDRRAFRSEQRRAIGHR